MVLRVICLTRGCFGVRAFIILAIHWVIALSLYFVWRAGVALCSISELGRVAATVGLIVPLISLGAQFPLWVAGNGSAGVSLKRMPTRHRRASRR